MSSITTKIQKLANIVNNFLKIINKKFFTVKKKYYIYSITN